MTLKEWFEESPNNIQAIGYGRNGQTYVYTRNTKSKRALSSYVDEVVELKDLKGYYGAWLYK